MIVSIVSAVGFLTVIGLIILVMVSLERWGE